MPSRLRAPLVVRPSAVLLRLITLLSVALLVLIVGRVILPATLPLAPPRFLLLLLLLLTLRMFLLLAGSFLPLTFGLLLLELPRGLLALTLSLLFLLLPDLRALSFFLRRSLTRRIRR